MRCPKCSQQMSGPRYRQTGFGTEVLTYRCACGYSKEVPTHDSERPDPIRGKEWTEVID